jgi:hypothetical protein
MSTATAPATSEPIAMTDDQLWTSDDLARLFRVSATTIQRWRQRGQLPAPVRIGKKPLWSSACVREALMVVGHREKATTR